MLLRRWVLASAFLVGCDARGELAVADPEPIGEMIAEFPAPFTGPIRLAELRDGRVLLNDTRERRLVRVNFSTGVQDTVATIGSGPLEYRSIYALATAADDSVWGFDIVAQRIMVFAPDGTPVRFFATTSSTEPSAALDAPWMRAVDPAGRWYGSARDFTVGPPARIGDSSRVVRVDPANGRMDSVAELATWRSVRTPSGEFVVSSFDTRDAWGAFADGRILIVRGADYGLELYDTSGAVHRAGPVPHRRVPLSRASAQAVLDSTVRLMGPMVRAAIAALPRGTTSGAAPAGLGYVLPDPLPTHWPLLFDDVVAVDRADRAWVRVRTAPLDSGAVRYDLIDREGRFVRAVELPRGEQLVGFGEGVVYVARRDDDDLLWLRRYGSP